MDTFDSQVGQLLRPVERLLGTDPLPWLALLAILAVALPVAREIRLMRKLRQEGHYRHLLNLTRFHTAIEQRPPAKSGRAPW